MIWILGHTWKELTPLRCIDDWLCALKRCFRELQIERNKDVQSFAIIRVRRRKDRGMGVGT
jgi:hypothetical protein